MDKAAISIGKMEIVNMPSTLTAHGSVSFDLKLGSFISLGIAGSIKVSINNSFVRWAEIFLPPEP